MTARLRSFWLPALALAYVSFAALQAGGRWPAWLALVLLPPLLAEGWRRTQPPIQGEDRVEPSARRALRAALWGAAVWLAARSGPAGHAGLDAAANLGAAAASVGGLVALARIAPSGGLLVPARASRSLDAAGFSALLWGVAVALPATRALLPPEWIVLDPLAIDYASTTAGIGSLFVLVATAFRLRVLRRLELGVSDRAAGALALAVAATAVAIPAAALDVAAPDRALPLAVVVGSVACAWTATIPEPIQVAGVLRGALAITVLGAPVSFLAAFVAQRAPAHAGATVLLACGALLTVGLIARAVARPLGPEQSRWLKAIDGACRGALLPEPDAALRAALSALSSAASVPGARPQIWRFDPEEALSVDIAGYLHVERSQAPERLADLALEEPERTLRAEVLRQLEVRRPDVRPTLAWFDARQAFSATLVMDEDGSLGFILLPQGGRSSPMTLEEARAVRVLADRISALLAVSSALARSRAREIRATARADALDAERERLERILALGEGRHRASAERLARPVRAAVYGPAARLALEQIEQAARANRPVTVQAPLGVDTQGWCALAHLASPRKGGPFVVVDASQGLAHDLAHWQHPSESPLALADGGTLCLLHAASLPSAVQSYLLEELTQRAETARLSSVPSLGLVASVPAALHELVSEGRMLRDLARLLGDAEIPLPSLAERAEDLRAIILAALAGAGQQARGEPLGADAGALRLLIEHRWSGNDLELESVLLRAAAVAKAPLVCASDLEAIGFVSQEVAQPAPTPHVTERRITRRPRPPPA